VDLERAAVGMLEVATASMANAVRQVTLERGLDPRDFTLIAYGGGGPLHAAAIARELQIGDVLIPRAPGVFSALGMLMADVRRDYVLTLFARLAEVDMAALDNDFRALESEGHAALRRSGVVPERIAYERAADMRYVGQEHSVAVRLPAEADRTTIKRLFDTAHQQRYSHSAADEPAEIVSLRVTAIGRLEKPVMPRAETGSESPDPSALRGQRHIVFAADRSADADVFDRAALRANNVIRGPAVIEESGATTLVEAGDSVTVNELGHLVMRLAASE
jgi:N-methylhydantoinase A